jgi:sulfite reductase alpha subunit-like flavoprotein
MNVVIMYESLTGTTRKAAYRMAEGLGRAGVTADVCPISRVDYGALAAADLVVIGTWTDGLVIIGQRPGRAQRLKKLPALDRKRCIVYCTYAVDPGKTLSKLSAIVEDRGGDVLGGMALRRLRLAEDVDDMVARLLETVVA